MCSIFLPSKPWAGHFPPLPPSLLPDPNPRLTRGQRPTWLLPHPSTGKWPILQMSLSPQSFSDNLSGAPTHSLNSETMSFSSHATHCPATVLSICFILYSLNWPNSSLRPGIGFYCFWEHFLLLEHFWGHYGKNDGVSAASWIPAGPLTMPGTPCGLAPWIPTIIEQQGPLTVRPINQAVGSY